MAAGWHRLVPTLVDARPVPRLVGVVPCLALGRAKALVLRAAIVGFRAVTLAVFPSVRPVHFPTPFHCAGGVPPRRAASGSLAMGVSTTRGFAMFTSRGAQIPRQGARDARPSSVTGPVGASAW